MLKFGITGRGLTELSFLSRIILPNLAYIMLVGPFIFCVLPDYISLFKGRIFVYMLSADPGLLKTTIIITLDVIASLIISLIFIIMLNVFLSPSIPPPPPHAAVENAFHLIANRGFDGPERGEPGRLLVWQMTIAVVGAINAMMDGANILLGYKPETNADIILKALNLTTLMTSIWTIFVMLTMAVIKMINGASYLWRAVVWIFDIDAHPIRVLGLIGGAIIWTGSVVYGLL